MRKRVQTLGSEILEELDQLWAKVYGFSKDKPKTPEFKRILSNIESAMTQARDLKYRSYNKADQ